jgi:hypothetical protein
MKNNLWGYIKPNGELIIPCIYNHAMDFSQGLAAVNLNEQYGYIDGDGKTKIPFQYLMAMSFNASNEAIVAKENVNYRTFVINKNGKILREQEVFDEHRKEIEQEKRKQEKR